MSMGNIRIKTIKSNEREEQKVKNQQSTEPAVDLKREDVKMFLFVCLFLCA